MTHAKSKLKGTVRFVLALLARAGLFMPQIDEAHAQTMRPFAGLSGKWSGDGSIVLSNGTTERLRCEATYVESGGGDNLDQTLRCASDSYNFDLHISLVDSAGAILGNWSELSRNVQGGISGPLKGPDPGDDERSDLHRRRDGRDARDRAIGENSRAKRRPLAGHDHASPCALRFPKAASIPVPAHPVSSRCSERR